MTHMKSTQIEASRPGQKIEIVHSLPKLFLFYNLPVASCQKINFLALQISIEILKIRRTLFNVIILKHIMWS